MWRLYYDTLVKSSLSLQCRRSAAAAAAAAAGAANASTTASCSSGGGGGSGSNSAAAPARAPARAAAAGVVAAASTFGTMTSAQQPPPRLRLFQHPQQRQQQTFAAAAAALTAAGTQQQHRAAHTLARGTVFAVDRKFSAADVHAFTALTGDANPIHQSSASDSSMSSATSSSSNGVREPIVPGLLLAALFPGIIGSNFPGALYATQSLAFRSPCAVGEAVCAEVTVMQASGRRVRFQTVCRAARDGRTLVDGEALAIIDQNM
jgi:3-hydroxybutyryl-CoA dehydratase